MRARPHLQGNPWERVLAVLDLLFYRRDFRDYQRLQREIRSLRHRWAPDPDLVAAQEQLDEKYAEMYEAAMRSRGTSMSGGSGGSGTSDPTEAEMMALMRLQTFDAQLLGLLERYTPREGTHRRAAS